MDHDHYSDGYILGILDRTRTIAMVGASPKTDRPSHVVMKFLCDRGYRVIPVNPRAAGETILGEEVFSTLSDVPHDFDMVDIFRSSEAAAAIVDETVRLAATRAIRTVWMQLGVRDDEAAGRAQAAGLDVVMNRCPKIEWQRLRGE